MGCVDCVGCVDCAGCAALPNKPCAELPNELVRFGFGGCGALGASDSVLTASLFSVDSLFFSSAFSSFSFSSLSFLSFSSFSFVVASSCVSASFFSFLGGAPWGGR